MLRNNSGHVKDSVSEATEVLSGMFNTHKFLLESGVEIQKRLESQPTSKKMGNSETALCVSGKHSKKTDEGGEDGCAFSPSQKDGE